MQLLPIFLVAIVLAADEGFRLSATHFGIPRMWSVVLAWLPMIIVLGFAWLGVWACRRRLDRAGSPRAILVAERITHYSRWFILAAHAFAVLAWGWLGVIRGVIGDLILLDEVLAILPPVVGILGTWWVYYPMERRLRESVLIRRLDEGLTVHPIPTRFRYVGMQARIGLLMLLVPLLMIVGLAEAIHTAARKMPWEWTPYVVEGATFTSAALVFLFAPVLVRVLLSVQPLAPGELREKLLEVCRRHRVRVRELLLWNTSGSMINAAVMGLIGPLRYVLITDALLEAMPQEEVRAVMAHEVGHVRRHHLPWLIAALLATLAVASLVVEGPLRLVHSLHGPILESSGSGQIVVLGGTIVQLALALYVFGWLSRRFERQADTFAVQHLSAASQDHGGRITPESVAAMTNALNRIAQLNAVDPKRHSWRHGSISWRARYLMSLIGAPIEGLAIDRTVRGIKAASALALLLAGGIWLLVW